MMPKKRGETTRHKVMGTLKSPVKGKPEGGKKLIIVESPTKAKTIRQIVGDDFLVESTMGHIMDLPERRFGVDLEDGFTPEYVIRPRRKGVVRRLRDIAQKAPEIYLASDPDREGEAIAWHVAQILDRPDAKRVEFHEITKPIVLKALKNPRPIDENLVNAQRARRILDRLFGYTLSPLLWQKIKRNLSAGRVQSVALRLVVERERSIRSFVSREYWTVTALLTPGERNAPFKAKLLRIGDRKVTTPEQKTHGEGRGSEGSKEKERDDLKGIVIEDEGQVKALVAVLEGARYFVSRVERGERKRTPPPPFITATLQQAAARKLGFNPTKTMRLAQRLYEGVNIGGEGMVGLITYMRTDSPRVSEAAKAQARDFIAQNFGPSFLPPQPRQFRAKKTAQQAHEAIRPTSVFRTPDRLKPYLDPDSLALYSLIWRRFIASQMADAVYDTLTVDIVAQDGANESQQTPEWLRDVHTFLFRATGRALKFSGWLRVYKGAGEGQGKDEEEWEEDEEGMNIPELKEGEGLCLIGLHPEQHFTKPPSRYTQATLIKAMEELGIGRPSTYAPTVDTLLKRGYVQIQDKQLIPTPLGTLVCDRLIQFFPDLLSVHFTAQMEERLDEVEEGKQDWRAVVRHFYEPFCQALKNAQDQMEREGEKSTGQKCPVCGAEMVLKVSAYGPFLACRRFPRCRALIPMEEGATRECPLCGGVMVRRGNEKGYYFRCLHYPDCPAMEPAEETVFARCPGCQKGFLIPKTVRKGRKKGHTFYSCSRYPECRFATWQKPLTDPCPRCGGLLVERRKGRRDLIANCFNPSCDFSAPIGKIGEATTLKGEESNEDL